MSGRREIAPGGTMVNFREPVTVEGFYLGRERKKVSTYPEGWFYTVEDSEGDVWSFFGTKMIDDKFEKIDVGEYVTIVYSGKTGTTKSGKPFKHFRVFVGQEDSGVSEEPTTTAPEEKSTDEIPF